MKKKRRLTLSEARAIEVWAKKTRFGVTLGPSDAAPGWTRAISFVEHPGAVKVIERRFGSKVFMLEANGIRVSGSLVEPLVEEALARLELPMKNSTEWSPVQAPPQPVPSGASDFGPRAWGEGAGLELEEPFENRHPQLVWKLIDEGPVRLAVQSTDRKPRKELLERLLDRRNRTLPGVQLHHLTALEGLRVQFPNFGEALDVIRDHLCLQRLAKGPISLPPLLLLGPPGVGKTYFVQKLGEALQCHQTTRSLAETSAAFVIVGSHSTWGNSQIGAVAKLAIEAPDETLPLLLLDEIDKANASNYSPQNSMLSLLEAHTARRFRDEHLDLEIDIRPMAFLMTANEPPKPDSPLASRVTTVCIEPPTAEQMPMIVRSVDEALRRDLPVLQQCFEPLSEKVIESLQSCAPRLLKKRLHRAYSEAARRSINETSARRLLLELAPFERSSMLGAATDRAGSRAARSCRPDVSLLVIDPSPFWRIH